MKKGLTILLVAACFLTLTLSMVAVMAENSSNNNDSNGGNNSSRNNKNISNMTFGRCVVESVRMRRGCFAEYKNISKRCVNASSLGKDNEPAKQCLSDYKIDIKDCKGNFKEAKVNCIQTYKPNIFQRMWHAFD